VILSGLHNHANGQYGHQHNYHKFNSYANVASLPTLMAQAGYRTARCGKYHVAPEEVYQFERTIPGPPRSPIVMARNCREFIEQVSDKPFFLYFCTSDPHRGGGEAVELSLQPNRFGNPAPGKSYPGIDEVIYDPKDVLVPGFLPDTPTCRAEIAQYYQSISRIDQGLGELIENLKSAGHWDDTLFVYISDHGIAMPGAKTTLYEGGMRSPCIIRNPFNEHRGVTTDAMASWVDLAPTILDFAGGLDKETGKARPELVAGLSMPPGNSQQNRELSKGEFHGRSLLPHLQQEHAEGWDEVFASHTFHEIQMYYPMRVVRGRRFKLIWNIAHPLPFPFASDLWAAPTWQAQYQQGLDTPYGAQTVRSYIQRPKFELFDLQTDPFEGNNLAEDLEYAGTLAIMVAKLQQFQQRSNDPWAIKWKYE
jgi:N-sulfoglucosamine sulfohydrolase